MKAVIADDEKHLRQYMRERLRNLWPELTICAEAANGLEAVEQVTRLRPDIIFLDIRMPGLDGMQVVKRIQGMCRVVFVTAFDEYAVQAFECHAVDYLLKPVTDDRLNLTIERLQQNTKQATDYRALMNSLASHMVKPPERLTWIKASVGDQIHLVHVDDVYFLKSDSKYTTVHCGNKEFIIKTPLKALEEKLNPDHYWRIHRAMIVNVNFVEKILRNVDGKTSLKIRHVEQPVPVSRAYTHLFRQM